MGSDIQAKHFSNFCSQCNVEHKTDIPYNPQGQGIVECAHVSLKTQLQKIKRGKLYPQSSHNALNHALFILNLLDVDACKQSASHRFWHDGTRVTFTK